MSTLCQLTWQIAIFCDDRTAEAIAAPISQLPRVVATIVPFDVERILSGAPIVLEKPAQEIKKVAPVAVQVPVGPISHYAEDVTPIGSVQWRKRAQVQGKVTSIKPAPSSAAPVLEIELWDESGGITLQFLGRREIALKLNQVSYKKSAQLC